MHKCVALHIELNPSAGGGNTLNVHNVQGVVTHIRLLFHAGSRDIRHPSPYIAGSHPAEEGEEETEESKEDKRRWIFWKAISRRQ